MHPKPRYRLCLFAMLATLLCCHATGSFAAVTFQTVGVTGEAVPGSSSGMEFTGLSPFPSINNKGQVTFKGAYRIPGEEEVTGQGVWAGSPGSLQLVIQDGDTAPDTEPDVRFSEISRYPNIDDKGNVSFYSSLEGPGIDASNNLGLWSNESSSPKLVAREGKIAPGTNHLFGGLSNQYSFRSPVVSTTGQTLFYGSLNGDGVDETNDQGIWLEDTDNQLHLVARTGNPAPGLGAGVYFSDLDGRPIVNNLGQTTFIGTVAGTGIDSSNQVGIWSGTPGNINLMFQSGGPAPGTEPGVIFDDSVFRAEVAENGQLSFAGSLSGPGISVLTNGTGIWAGMPESLQLIARGGDRAPGTDEGVVFGYLVHHEQSANGAIVFEANLTGPGVNGLNDEGLWSNASGELRLIARGGSQAPGTDEGVVFDFGDFWSPSPVVNSSGQIILRARLRGPGVDHTNDYGLWIAQPNGDLELIVREGDLFDVNDDPLIEDLRRINSVDQLFYGSDGTNNGYPASFNDAGQNLFRLVFDDDTLGFFIANTRLPGDLNSDGFVGVDDLNLILLNWNQSVTPWDFTAGDISGDGFVGVDDLNLVLSNWNTGTPPTNATSVIPEPGTLFWLAPAALGWYGARRR